MYSFVTKIFQFELKQIFNKIKTKVLSYIVWIYTSWNEYFVDYTISHLRYRSDSLEGQIYTSKRKTSHQKDHKHFRRIAYPKGFVQKGDHQKDVFHEISHLQSFYYMIHGSGLKAERGMTRSKKGTDKSKRLLNPQTATFSLLCYFQRLRKKAASSLASLRLVDQRGTRLKIYKLQRIEF